MGDVVRFPRYRITKEDLDWESPDDMLASIIDAIDAGEFKPVGVVVALVGEEESAVFRYAMERSEVAEFFKEYFDSIMALPPTKR